MPRSYRVRKVTLYPSNSLRNRFTLDGFAVPSRTFKPGTSCCQSYCVSQVSAFFALRHRASCSGVVLWLFSSGSASSGK